MAPDLVVVDQTDRIFAGVDRIDHISLSRRAPHSRSNVARKDMFLPFRVGHKRSREIGRQSDGKRYGTGRIDRNPGDLFHRSLPALLENTLHWPATRPVV